MRKGSTVLMLVLDGGRVRLYRGAVTQVSRRQPGRRTPLTFRLDLQPSAARRANRRELARLCRVIARALSEPRESARRA